MSDPHENLSTRTPRSLIISEKTPCSAAYPVIQHNTTLQRPVVLDLRLRRRSGFVLNKCSLHLVAPASAVISLVLLEMSCRNRISYVHVIDSSNRRLSWKSCVRHINPGVDWLSGGNTASIRVELHTDEMFTARMNALAVTKPKPGTIQTRFLTPNLGYIQSVGMQLNLIASPWNGPVQTNTWTHLAVPGHNAVLISVAIAGLGSIPLGKVCHHRVELYEGSMNKTVWRLCSRYHSLPQPHISYEGDVHIHFVFDQNDDKLMQGVGFRLIYTFHVRASIPTCLTNATWNCSTPTWLDFQRHFICDLVIQCAGGEDERDCPAYTQCGHNGCLFNGKCFSFTPLDPGTTWHQANVVCSNLAPGGRLFTTKHSLRDLLMATLRTDIASYSGHPVLLGTSSANVDSHFYAQLDQRTDTTVHYYVLYHKVYTFETELDYSYCDLPENCLLRAWHFVRDMCVQYVCYALCETHADRNEDEGDWVKPDYRIALPNATSSESRHVPFPHVACDSGHVAHAFLAFDRHTHCVHEATSGSDFCSLVRGWNSSACSRHAASLPVPFTCRSQAQHVHYTLVCDHRQDCQDNSDEGFCSFPPCDPSVYFQCETEQECQPLRVKCNYQPDCLDGSDEGDCQGSYVQHPTSRILPVIVDLEGRHGYPILIGVKNTTHPYCPHTHYLCPSDGNCLPVFTRCNEVADCSGKEDERECENYVCPGLYRCRGQDMCVLPGDLCDGVLHCPQHDDERFCNLTCPDHCTCVGYAFVCHRPSEGRRVHQLRYLDAQGSGMTLEALAENVMLIYLNLARCNIMQITNVTLPNLNTMDLSDNKITAIDLSDFNRFQRLHDLKLSGNPIVSFVARSQSGAVGQHSELHTLDLSRVKLETLSLSVLAPFSRLQLLNLSQSAVKTVQVSDERTSMPRTLRQLDARGCDFTEFPRTLFQGVDSLKVVYADTYKLCCPVVLPDGFVVHDCHAPFNEISSCDALLRSNFYRGCLFVLATFGLLGNSVSFLARLCVKKSNSSRSGFVVFVQHLCVSDFFMGLYLVFIGAVDRLFLNNYLWEDTSWRHSATCKLAGFISLTSCEVSSFVICLITVDRFLVLRFPFSHLRFRFVSAQIASVSAWIVGSALAAIPLLPAAQAWQFYSQTGICIPLPVTRQEFAGRGYAFGVMIVLNFLLFILIAGGQLSIYFSIQASRMSDGETSSKSHDAAIARRLITVAVSDFLCWFPVGLLGLLASSGTPVPGTVNVAMAIFVLPLNSALNPFLYTLNMLQERFQKRKEDRILKALMQQS